MITVRPSKQHSLCFQLFAKNIKKGNDARAAKEDGLEKIEKRREKKRRKEVNV